MNHRIPHGPCFQVVDVNDEAQVTYARTDRVYHASHRKTLMLMRFLGCPSSCAQITCDVHDGMSPEECIETSTSAPLKGELLQLDMTK